MTEPTLPMAVAVVLLAVRCLSHLLSEQLARVQVKETLSGKRSMLESPFADARILVVDDEETNVRSLTRILRAPRATATCSGRRTRERIEPTSVGSRTPT